MIVRTLLPRLLLGLAILISALSLALNRYQLDPALIEGAIHNLGVCGQWFMSRCSRSGAFCSSRAGWSA
jgi:hypothetical protein